MPFEPIFETITANNRKTVLSDHVKVECKTEIPTETVRKILNISVFSALTNHDNQDGYINYAGKAVFYICYEDNDSNIRKCECGSEFKGTINAKDAEGCRVIVGVSTEKTEADVSGIRLLASAILCVKAEVRSCVDANALIGGENLICESQDVSIKKGFGLKEGVYPVEEEFEIGYPIEEVLFHRAEPIVTAVQCGVGCIIIDGEIRLSAILLQKNEKKDIIKENKNLPFRIEVEYEDAMPSLIATSKATLKSFKTDIAVDENNSKSTVTASVILAFASEAFSIETVNIAKDVFSLTDNTEIEKGELCFSDVCDLRTGSAKISSVYPLDETVGSATLKAVAGEKAEIISTSVSENRINVTGTLTTTAYFKSEEDRAFTRKIELPFEAECNCVASPGCQVEVVALADCVSYKTGANGIELDTDLTFSVYPTETRTVNYVKGVKSTGNKQVNDCAISVYIPIEGENLWSLAKRLNVSPESLSATNPDLQFPLTGKERIVVYRQK